MNQAIQNGFVNGTVVLCITTLQTNNKEVLVYPNPATDNFNIVIPEQLKSASEMYIYNMQGQLVQTESIAGKENLQIDAQTWTPGFYVGILNCDGNTVQVKLIKE